MKKNIIIVAGFQGLNKYDDIEKAKNDYGYPLICVADDDELEI